MAGGLCSQLLENDLELLTLPSCNRRNSGDSGSSWVSTLSGTLKGSNSLLSCSESELSVRTGSTAYKRLPPRPAPPPPPPIKPTNSRKTPPKTYSPANEEMTPSFSTLPAKKYASIPPRNKSPTSKTLSFKKKPHLSRALSSDMFNTPQAFSLPADQMSRTFSSDGLRHILYSLPPAYPPPPPPDSPPLPPYVPLLSSKSTIAQTTPPPPRTPPLPLPPKSERRLSPTGIHTTSNSSLEASEYQQDDDGRSNDQRQARQNGHPCLFNIKCLCLITCISLILSLTCCFFTAYYVGYHSLGQRLEICLNRDIFKNYNTSKFLENLITDDKREYCAKTNREISHLIHAALISPKNDSESRNRFHLVSAHIHFQANISCGSVSQSPKRLTFSQPGKPSERFVRWHSSNVAVTKDALTISHSGKYFVYSGMYFRQHCLKTRQQQEFWGHTIILKREGDTSEETLAVSNHTCLSNCGSDVHTSYTGGIFQLKKNDRIYVSVTREDLVVTGDRGSYLGVVLVGIN